MLGESKRDIVVKGEDLSSTLRWEATSMLDRGTKGIIIMRGVPNNVKAREEIRRNTEYRGQ
jgi:hypothetical protein